MADLINEFFERELSEAEADSLGDLLDRSPDSAMRFEGLLENHYALTGLPLPELPPSLLELPRGPKGLWGSAGLKILLVLAAAGLGFLAWKVWPSKPEASLQPQASLPVPLSHPVPAAPAAKKPELPASGPLSVGPRVPDASAQGDELSVVVGAQEKTLVTVRVLDAKGGEVRSLYTGFVQPGHWSFRWDGDLSNGQPAPSGDYRIDVQTGALHQTKDIRIKPN